MSATGQNNVDIDALLDLTEYDAVSGYSSPSLSPTNSSKPTFASPVTASVTTPSLSTSTSQTLSGPSHNYDLYPQQTGFVPGAIANTMAMNQTNNTGYQDFGSLDLISGFSPENELFDFNTSPSQNTMGPSDIDMDFDSPVDSQHFLSTINPSSIEQDASNLPSPSVPAQTSSVGRLWPGAHSQAALAKAQAQQKQQQQLIQQQTQRPNLQQKTRARSSIPADPLVEQKITQLLNSMRAKPASSDDDQQSSSGHLNRAKKEEEEMDEDERLLASEEGKKLSSKERRQLRNKVSARAFRSRRKEYISQLESEIATKVNENGDLRAQNRALLEENKRLSDLTRMLLSSSSFSTFLDHLSSNSSAVVKSEAAPQTQQQEQTQVSKDVAPYSQQTEQQQIGMAMIPEQNVDFSILSLNNGMYGFQPQVFVVDTPEFPAPIDTSMLSGKASNLVEESFESDNEKMEVAAIDRPTETLEPVEQPQLAPVDEEFESNPDFALFHSEPTKSERSEEQVDSLVKWDIFYGIEPEKILFRYKLVDAVEEEASAAVALARVQRISANIESVVSRLENLTIDL